jgi:hypothetical protein
MKGLSGQAEWFWVMAKNWKPVENRSWPITRYFKKEELPVRVYLHGSKTSAEQDDIDFITGKLKPWQLHEFEAVDWSKYRGAIMGEITIVDQVVLIECGIQAGSKKALQAVYSGWFFGVYGFVVEQGKLYEAPIPYKGQLGFFDVQLPEHK